MLFMQTDHINRIDQYMKDETTTSCLEHLTSVNLWRHEDEVDLSTDFRNTSFMKLSNKACVIYIM